MSASTQSPEVKDQPKTYKGRKYKTEEEAHSAKLEQMREWRKKHKGYVPKPRVSKFSSPDEAAEAKRIHQQIYRKELKKRSVSFRFDSPLAKKTFLEAVQKLIPSMREDVAQGIERTLIYEDEQESIPDSADPIVDQPPEMSEELKEE